jgi:hypothetical protein
MALVEVQHQVLLIKEYWHEEDKAHEIVSLMVPEDRWMFFRSWSRMVPKEMQA